MVMQIEERAIDTIKPYEQNPRVNDNAVDAVAGSIKEFGFRVPIIVDAEGVIVAGHTRWKAARKLGLERVPVHVANDLSPEQIRALRIADNQTASLSEWDAQLLPIELSALQQADYDLSILGFDSDTLARWLSAGNEIAEGLTDPDAVPEPPDEAVSKLGEVYVLGEHRLMCGDSANPADVDKMLAGAPIHLVVTDPPYGVHVEPRSNNAIAAGLSSFPSAASGQSAGQENAMPIKLRAKDHPLINDAVTEEEFAKLLRAWFGNIARVLLPGHSLFCWGGYANLSSYPSALRECGFHFSQVLVWDKQHPVLTRKDFLSCFELLYYSWREGAAHRFFGPNNAHDIWPVKKVSSQNMVHLTEKPVELATRAIQYSSLAGENVLDLFGGSGSTLIACEQTGRRAFLMELNPLYCDVIRKRYAEFSQGAGCDWENLTPAEVCVEADQ